MLTTRPQTIVIILFVVLLVLWLQDSSTANNIVLGNHIGPNARLSVPLSNTDGILIQEPRTNHVIDSKTAVVGNLISGNAGDGIVIEDNGTTNNQVIGNYIGTDTLGSGSIPNGGSGIHLQDGAKANTIGISNTITYNASAGVTIEGETTLGNTITRNIIYQNGGLPIDWANTDSIPAPPILTSYSSLNNVLLGSACGSCRVEIFASESFEPPAGMVFLDAVTADTSGNFTLTLDSPLPLCYLSVTATDLNGNTSEFSSVLDTSPPLTTPTATSTPTPTVTDISPTATATTTPTATAANYTYFPLVSAPLSLDLYLPLVMR